MPEDEIPSKESWIIYDLFKKKIQNIGLTSEQYDKITLAYLEAVGL